MSKEINTGELCEITFWGAIIILLLLTLTQMSFRKSYIDEYTWLASREQRMYKIPTSVILAQGILESGWGESKGAIKYNNHFGIRCQRSKHYKECVNYVDAGQHVHLMKYPDEVASFRHHSIYLTTGKYEDMTIICGKDYVKWCDTLQKRGYSSDKKYSEKLKKIIKDNNLTRYDYY